MIKLRMDVDYPYASRYKSFAVVALNRKKPGREYLKNAKIIARMVNKSPKDIKAYWFFTPYTVPDEEMLGLMHPERHEVALHVANDPYGELDQLEKSTGRKISYYTVHGTARLIGKVIWRRKLSEAKKSIPADFPLQSFYEYPTFALDWLRHRVPFEQAKEEAEEKISIGEVVHVHPEWLFQRGTFNHRGPYYDVLRSILQVDKELEGVTVQKRRFFKLARRSELLEYKQDFVPTEECLSKLKDQGVDILTFIERKWCYQLPYVSAKWIKTTDNIALANVPTYTEWFEKIGKKTRNMIRKAEKSGITTKIVEPSEKLAEGMWKIFNETPIRQGRAFPHYGEPLESVRAGVLSSQQDIFIGAYYQDELIGFIQLVFGDNIAIISQILSLQSHWDKAVNNALVAKAIEVCTAKQVQWVMYGRMGNHPSLDSFKQNNNFSKFEFPRYYVPLTRKGQIATALRLHMPLKDALPQWLKKPLFPAFSWISRTKLKIRQKLH
jgi:hypothetical protein